MSRGLLEFHTFEKFSKLIYDIAGINMVESKLPLVSNRLAKRLRFYQYRSYEEYLEHVLKNDSELQIMVDLLTTNETYFFREEKHFDILKEIVTQKEKNSPLRVWSAACSIGAEPYSIALTLESTLGKHNWEIIGSDISTRVLQRAKMGHYPIEMSENIPKDMLKKYFLKGVNEQEGSFLVKDNLRKNITFSQINLNTDLPSSLGEFDVVFLRNVMIYFDEQKKIEILKRVYKHIKVGGYLLVGHSETLTSIKNSFTQIVPTVYKKEF